jgi:hypothetical protein
MPLIAIIFGILLDVLGTSAFLSSGSQAPTALIPAAFGTILLICGVLAKANPGIRKHVMHVAALVGLLGTLGGLGMGLPKLGAVLNHTAARPMAVWVQLGMGVLCLIFLVLCVKSFIDARRARPEDYGAK